MMMQLKFRPRDKHSGFVLITALMLLILFTGASLSTLYAVTASIKGTGYMRERLQTIYYADGGWLTVYGFMCEHALTQAKSSFTDEYANSALAYGVTITDLRVVKRKLPGYSGELLGRDVLLVSSDRKTGKAEQDVLVFLGQTYLSGGYGNE